MTFCGFNHCSNFSNCSRALTEQVLEEAIKWWGDDNPPIVYFATKPECYNAIQNSED